ncbi:MAG: hypothetical protein LBL07_14275 [Tannerella sp.]|nr:hypothetical protein [Tannerella sp.]
MIWLLLVDAYANDFSRILLLKFAWNFNYCRRMKDGSKRLNNTDTDSGLFLGAGLRDCFAVS